MYNTINHRPCRDGRILSVRRNVFQDHRRDHHPFPYSQVRNIIRIIIIYNKLTFGVGDRISTLWASVVDVYAYILLINNNNNCYYYYHRNYISVSRSSTGVYIGIGNTCINMYKKYNILLITASNYRAVI